MTLCLLSCISNSLPSEKGSTLKQIAPVGSKLFPFRIDPVPKGSRTILKVHIFPLNISLFNISLFIIIIIIIWHFWYFTTMSSLTSTENLL